MMNRLIPTVLVCVCLAGPGSSLAGNVYALLIGADEYEHLGTLAAR